MGKYSLKIKRKLTCLIKKLSKFYSRKRRKSFLGFQSRESSFKVDAASEFLAPNEEENLDNVLAITEKRLLH